MRFLFSLFIILAFSTSAQINVYECPIYTLVTQQDIDQNNTYTAPCILFDGVYNFGQNDSKEVIGVNQINVEPGFTAFDFYPGTGMDLILCDYLKDVVCFSHTDLNNVEALKKFEIGINLPNEIEQRIQEFIYYGDSSINGINPYLEWELNAEATFVHKSTGYTKKIDGFYFQDYERNTLSGIKNNWHWDSVPTSHHIRFRYAPEKTGIWNVSIEVKLEDSTIYSYCPFMFNATPNTDNDGYVKIANNNRVLEKNGDLFFPVGQSLPWADDESTGLYGINGGAYTINPVNPWSFTDKMEPQIQTLDNFGADYFRLILNPAAMDIEFEEVGNYTDRLKYAWEIDSIINNAEEKDMYIHFNMLIHFNFWNISSYHRFAWDWGSSTSLTNPPGYYEDVINPCYGYRTKFGIGENEATKFFSDENCKKYYKQKLRYLISRYGYSTHIALFELLSEPGNACQRYKEDTINLTTSQLPTIKRIPGPYGDPYSYDPVHQTEMAKWHEEMAKYIKNDLGHTEHLIAANYAVRWDSVAQLLVGPPANDYTFDVPEIDVMTVNHYPGKGIQVYHNFTEILDQIANNHPGKPLILSETGPLEEDGCDNGNTYRKEAWMSAFTGVAGFCIYNFRNPSHYEVLGDINQFFKSHQEIEDIFLSDGWTHHYIGDNGPNSAASRKEANFVRGYSSPYAFSDVTTVGVVSNMTNNRITNAAIGDTVCSDSLNIPTPLLTKSNLYSTQSPLYINIPYTLVMYDDYYHSNGVLRQSNSTPYGDFPGVSIAHPLSCVTNSCTYPDLNSSEIPFIRFNSYTGHSMENFESEYTSIRSNNNRNSYKNGEKNSTDQNNAVGFYLYPNPATTEIQFYCSDQEVTNYELSDLYGKAILTIQNNDTGMSIDISNFNPGIYVLKAKTELGTTKYKQRWVKQ